MPDPFYQSRAWKDIRLQRIRKDGWRCTQCGCRCRGRKFGEPRPHVDHIRTRREHPELALDINNLRTLCEHHHNQRTRLDQIGRPYIGPDGYPVDLQGDLPGQKPYRTKQQT